MSEATGSKPPVAVFDVDGVLADVRHRLQLLASTPKRWEEFFAAADRDPLLPDGAELVRELADTYPIVYLTGRPERTRDLTARWLRRHRLPVGDLLMRPDRDHRPARLFKRERCRTFAREGGIVLVVDDDPEVVGMLRSDGYVVRQADWLPYAEPLGRAQEADGRT